MGRPKLTPRVAYNLAEALYDSSGERDWRLESVIAQDPYLAFLYSTDILQGPFPAGESAIVRDNTYSYMYEKYRLKIPEDRRRFRELKEDYWIRQREKGK